MTQSLRSADGRKLVYKRKCLELKLFSPGSPGGSKKKKKILRASNQRVRPPPLPSLYLSLTHNEQGVLHVVPQAGYRDERERGKESASGENHADKSIIARPERLGAECVDACAHPIEDASVKPAKKRESKAQRSKDAVE